MYYLTYPTSDPSADIFRVRKAGFLKETGTQPSMPAGFPYCHAIVGLVSSIADGIMFAQKLSSILLLDSLFHQWVNTEQTVAATTAKRTCW